MCGYGGVNNLCCVGGSVSWLLVSRCGVNYDYGVCGFSIRCCIGRFSVLVSVSVWCWLFVVLLVIV